MIRAWVLPVLALAIVASATAETLGSVQITGSQRLRDVDLLAQTGLKPGSPASKASFDEACEKLMHTGLLDSCTYRFEQAGSDLKLEFAVKESTADQTARLTLPGVDETKLWAWLKVNEPLVLPMMPASDEAIRFYTAAVQRYMRENHVDTNLNPTFHSDLATKQVTIVFRPANLPRITDVAFIGVHAFPPARLRDAILKQSTSMGFTEYDFRQLLDENVKPLYEESGYLKVVFPAIETRPGSGGLIVQTTVDEGSPYRLTAVRVNGPGPSAAPTNSARFDTGATANWKKLQEGVDGLLQQQRNAGYLQAKANLEPKFNQSAKTVSVDVTIQPGRQFKFAALSLKALNPSQEKRVRALWKLSPGQPMNEGYVNEFVTQAFKSGGLGPEYSGVGQQLNISPDTGDVTVEITFRR